MMQNDVNRFFPLPSQTSPEDRLWLARAFDWTRQQFGAYHYTEVGSYTGGTLTPARLDERCQSVLSIDPRPAEVADSRGLTLDYSRVTTAMMLENLARVPGGNLAKLKTLDGTAKDCPFGTRKAHITFIDAEHTDEAVFADFVWCQAQMFSGGLCLFHDTCQVTAGIQNILTLLEHQGRRPCLVAPLGTSVSLLFLDREQNQVPEPFASARSDWASYKRWSQDQVLLFAIRTRWDAQLGLKPARVEKQ